MLKLRLDSYIKKQQWKMFDVNVTLRYNNIKYLWEGPLWTLKKSYSERIIYLHGKIF